MSAYSTLRITRDKAKAYILAHILNNLKDDAFLETQMDILLHDRLYNCQIVDNNFPNDDNYL